MAVRSKEEIINAIKSKFGDDTSDDTIGIIEDIADTYDDLKGSNSDGKDWKAEAERIDKEWREKYVARFTGGSNDDDDIDPPKPEPKKYSYEKLFE